jgi:hypothetical protein
MPQAEPIRKKLWSNLDLVVIALLIALTTAYAYANIERTVMVHGSSSEDY